jgi:hypothetical protein
MNTDRQNIFNPGPYYLCSINQDGSNFKEIQELQYDDINFWNYNSNDNVYYIYPSIDNIKEYCFKTNEELARYIYYIELNETLEQSDDQIIEFINNKYTSDYLINFKSNVMFPLDQGISFFDREIGDDGLMHRAHPSIYDARITKSSKSRELSSTPRELWTNKKITRYMCHNRLYYIGCCSPKKIFKGYTIARLSKKVTIFRATIARYLISVYLNDVHEIFDPFSGYSGRLLGSILNNKKYIGHDINQTTVSESNKLLDAIKQFRLDPSNNPYKIPKHYLDLTNIDASVSVQDIFTDTPDHEYESLFTCSPYANNNGIPKESWNYHYDQSTNKYISDDSGYNTEQWIDYILDKYKCKKYLFVVDYMGKYSKFEVENIKNQSHMNTNFEHVLFFNRSDVKDD